MGFAGGVSRLWLKKAHRSNGSKIGEKARTSSRKRYRLIAALMILNSRPRLSERCTFSNHLFALDLVNAILSLNFATGVKEL